MLHLAAAFRHGVRVHGTLHTDWPDADPFPFSTVTLADAHLSLSTDPLADAVDAIIAACHAAQPHTRLRERPLLAVACDRTVQALLLLGHATGNHDRAVQWSARLTDDLWPTRTRTAVSHDDTGPALVRGTCCFHVLEGHRCANCPIAPSTPT
ncbi:hypothetical protein [Deinococcus maricopensis]|uniref:Ferric siderophore reductase C-terminal domain-containing protein n=1 Tax=Deinococcus maricopensis (strain DSM 21211 / LMG 22137 / NRRL B-23946 / LB-34) TaxID=709986 RepID=E8UAN8_DEIML|nr:hypothetical protein [Deinococcus maricopensis]ADV68127.1 hypothetical protein Deima_2492 [Deinococcus maricopensis DSM 21211]